LEDLFQPILHNLTTPPVENSGLSDFLTVILKKKPWKEKNVEVRSFQGKAYTLRAHNGDPPHLILMRSLQRQRKCSVGQRKPLYQEIHRTPCRTNRGVRAVDLRN
jgi:hypothetical protein